MMRRFIPQLMLLLCASPWLFASLRADAQESSQKVPENRILVHGAVASASDDVTPEAGDVIDNVYRSEYFRLSYALPAGWIEEFKGPPPSDSGSYVLAQVTPSEKFKGPSKGTLLVTAQDLFFSLVPATNAMEMIKYTSDKLPEYYTVERAPTEVKIADHSFVRFDYMSPAAELHWVVLATEIRCHTVQFIFTSPDVKLIERLIKDMNKMNLPAGTDAGSGTGGKDDLPVCIADYAVDVNMTHSVSPAPTDHKFNPVPVRIIIDKQGKVKHVHLLSAFPDEAKAITDAMDQWRFKPYVRDGKPLEVETGILFGAPDRVPRRTSTGTASPGSDH
jgi:hypothetical protein